MIKVWSKILYLCLLSTIHLIIFYNSKSTIIKLQVNKNRNSSKLSKSWIILLILLLLIFKENTNFITLSLKIFHIKYWKSNFHNLQLNKNYIIWQHLKNGYSKKNSKKISLKNGFKESKEVKLNLIINLNQILKLICIPINLQEKISSKF